MLGPAIVAPAIRWRADQIVWAPVMSDSRLLRFIDRQNDVTKMSLRWDEERKILQNMHILSKASFGQFPAPVCLSVCPLTTSLLSASPKYLAELRGPIQKTPVASQSASD